MTQTFDRLFIFEIANNHQGSLDHGLEIVRAIGALARTHGIKAAAKLQYRDLDTFIHPHYRDRIDLPHIPRFMATRLSDADFRALVEAIRDEGLVSIVTPFDERSVERAVDHGIEILKVASCSADDWPLLEAIAAVERPVIVSTGGLSLRDIDAVSTFCANRRLDYALLHCVAVYPTPVQSLNLSLIGRMTRRYPGVSIGYSGHEDPNNLDVVAVAVSQGATILERHVGIPGPAALNAYSLNPEQADAWVRAALNAREICGTSERRAPGGDELASLLSLKRGVYVVRPIAQGMPIERKDVMFAMPCADGQTTSGEFGQHRSRFVASRNYERFEAVREQPVPDLIRFTRDIIHDARGMLNEAGITMGSDVTVELSHHYGLAEFRTTGAIFITVADRDYCKKLAVVLPGQAHPGHFHRIKEETFHLLWGDLDLGLNHERVRMKPGDRVLVPPGACHDFTSRCGAIFEEISTKNHRGDSYYTDERIQRLDPMERKTVLDAW